jgi:HPt (histidine-containing phosphotransfer) domain-containing protein
MSGPVGEALDTGVIDGLRASVEGDTAFVIELIDAFLADSATQLQAIDIAVTAGDPEAVVRPAHTLKSASATLGAMQLSTSARTLEMAGRAGSIDSAEAREAAATIRAAWDAAAAALRAWSADQDR